MKEFMLLIRNEIDSFSKLAPDKQQEFLQACMVYIKSLTKNGNLISAQPMERQGKIITRSQDSSWKDGPFIESKEAIVGYYHILAKDLEDAIAIAKQNPEFLFSKTARIEVRPIKMKEVSTGFVYPKEEAKVL